jgi:hypothetical protein
MGMMLEMEILMFIPFPFLRIFIMIKDDDGNSSTYPFNIVEWIKNKGKEKLYIVVYLEVKLAKLVIIIFSHLHP